MERIFDAPMSPIEGEEGLRCLRFRGQDGQEISHFDGRLPFVGAAARDLGHMGNARPVRLQVGTELPF